MKIKLFKNKKGSILVEKILMVAFAVAAGGAVVVYGSNVITNAKNTQITGILDDTQNDEQGDSNLPATYNDSNHSITLSIDALNHYGWDNFEESLPIGTNPIASMSYGGSVCSCNEYMKQTNMLGQFTYYVDNYSIFFNFNNYWGDDFNDNHFGIFDKTTQEYVSFDKKLTITFVSSQYENAKFGVFQDAG